MEMIQKDAIERRIFAIAGQKAILDSDVADLYSIETKRVNEAVRNNPEKFPEGYIIALTKTDWDFLKSKYSSSIRGGKVKLPLAFTEKGLYMLATILKSDKATATTIGIIETFARIRLLANSISRLTNVNDEKQQGQIISESNTILTEIIDDNLRIQETETSIELNLVVLKIKHKVSRK